MITELMTYQGYPHWLSFRGGVLTLVTPKPVEIGHGFTFMQHLSNVDRKQTIVHRVVAIDETRAAKGNYETAKEVFFYRIQTEKMIEDTSEQELIVSHSY
jgi:hypothetical protein